MYVTEIRPTSVRNIWEELLHRKHVSGAQKTDYTQQFTVVWDYLFMLQTWVLHNSPIKQVMMATGTIHILPTFVISPNTAQYRKQAICCIYMIWKWFKIFDRHFDTFGDLFSKREFIQYLYYIYYTYACISYLCKVSYIHRYHLFSSGMSIMTSLHRLYKKPWNVFSWHKFTLGICNIKWWFRCWHWVFWHNDI